jgi:hypothetical protein
VNKEIKKTLEEKVETVIFSISELIVFSYLPIMITMEQLKQSQHDGVGSEIILQNSISASSCECADNDDR